MAAMTEVNKIGGHTIVPDDLYLKEFIGNFPVNILVGPLRFFDGQLVKDDQGYLDDSRIFDYKNYPLVTVIQNDSVTDPRHSLLDPLNWGIFIGQKIFQDYLSNIEYAKLTPQEWNHLREIFKKLPDDLTMTVHGNHFFFVGEKGASETAKNIAVLETRTSNLKRWLDTMQYRI
jgi:hypothetical protein